MAETRLATGIEDADVETLVRYEFFANELSKAPKGKVLVIPAGDGFGVDWLVKQGFDAYGVDGDTRLVGHARRHFDPSRYTFRTLETLLRKYAPGEFDSLVSVQIPLPYTRQLLLYNTLRSFAAKASSLVKEDGMVLVSLQQHGACSIPHSSFVSSSVRVLGMFLKVERVHAQLYDRVFSIDKQQALEGKYKVPQGYAAHHFSLLASCRH
jgi:hypothetical protein